MGDFIDRHGVWLSTTVAVGVAVFLALNWEAAPMTQRLVGLYFIAISLHEWEEMRFPGGFVDLVTSSLGLDLKNPGAAKLVLFAAEMVVSFVPLFFPQVMWLCLAPLVLGYVETLAHLLATRMNARQRFYSPGLVTAVLVMLPISVFGTWHLASHGLAQPLDWLCAAAFLFAIVLCGQASIVKASGMRYADFVRAARRNLLGRRQM
jgi:hypothetical protein